jgi:Zn-dependent M32 family carboxypeptidase
VAHPLNRVGHIHFTTKEKTAMPSNGVPSKTVFVIQRQDRKNGKWTDDAGQNIFACDRDLLEGQFHIKKRAVDTAKEAQDDVVSDAQSDYEDGGRSHAFDRFIVEKGTDLDKLIEDVKKAHKKFNPKGTKEKKPFDPDAVYPKFRVVARTYLDEPLGD